MTPRSPTRHRPRARSSRRGASLLLALAAALAGCGDPTESRSAPAAAAAHQRPAACVDTDLDGYGPACVRGEDCDDDDAAITDACYRCQDDAPGCACAVDGQALYCPKVTITIGNQTSCGPGYATCQHGVWSECVLNFTAVGGAT